MHKASTRKTPTGWQGIVIYDGQIIHYTKERFEKQADAAQAGWQWIKEWMADRVCSRNAVELP